MIVYWSNGDIYSKLVSLTGLRRLQPYPVRRIMKNRYDVIESNTDHEAYYRCPAHTEHLKNLFAVPAPYDCDLIIDKQPNQPEFVTSTFVRNNEDFNKFFIIRSIKNRLFSVNVTTLMITDSDDVEVSQMPAYLESNGFVDNTVVIPGTFNLGIWPRVLECAFHLKENRMFVKEGDPLFYLKFHTKEKVVFKEFLLTQRMRNYVDHMLASRNHKNKLSKMQFFYDMVARKKGFKQRMLEEAKANVIGE